MPRKKGTIYNDLSGQRLGKLVVIERDFSKDYPRPYFLCKCDCGEETVICSSSLTRKKKPTRSCGCGAREARTLSEGIANARAVFTSYKASAKNREIPFNISKKDFLELTSQDCFYCGGEPSMIRSEKRSIEACLSTEDGSRVNMLFGWAEEAREYRRKKYGSPEVTLGGKKK